MSISCNSVGFNASLVAQIIKNTSKKETKKHNN
jgi:hypothetical protein